MKSRRRRGAKQIRRAGLWLTNDSFYVGGVRKPRGWSYAWQD